MWIAPGAAVAKQTPSRPVNFAYPTAAIAPTSSCRTWMNRMRSCALRSASIRPLIPSPGSPKIVSTPQPISRSTRTSDAVVVVLIDFLRCG